MIAMRVTAAGSPQCPSRLAAGAVAMLFNWVIINFAMSGLHGCA
jgi:hypothetical protein